MIIGIVAIAKNYAIGKGGKLPWHYPADLKFFKETTTGNVIVMGSTTWTSIGRPLPGRLNVILTRSRNVDAPETVLKLSSTEEITELAKYMDRDVYIIGGAEIFASFAQIIEKWTVTMVPVEVEDADTFMPPDFLDAFEVEQSKDLGEGLQVKTLHRRSI